MRLVSAFLKAHAWRSAVAVSASVASGILAVAIPVSIGLYYNLVFGFTTRRASALSVLPEAWTATVPAFLIFLLALVMVRSIVLFVERYSTSVLGEYFAQSLRERMFQHQLRARMSYYDEQGTGKYLLRYSGDLTSIQNFLTNGIFRFVGDALLLIVALVAMAILNVVVAFVVFAGIMVTVTVVHLLNRKLYHISSVRRDRRSGLVAFVSERLRGILAIKVLNREAVEMKRFTKRSRRLLEIGKTFRAVRAAIASVIPALSYVVLIATLWYVYIVSIRGVHVLPAGELVGFVLLFVTILPVLRRVLRVESTWKLGLISFRKLIRILEQDTEAPRGEEKKDITGDLTLTDVSFAYGDKPIFSSVTCTLPWQRTVFVRVRPGRGRTTLVKLLTAVYLPDAGRIRYGELDASDIDPWNVRRAIAVASPALPLLGRTVFEAISDSKKADRMAAAAEMLACVQQGAPRIERLQIEDPIGEMGSALSTAQRMRLMYARALLSDKPYLLIEDDFTWGGKKNREHIARIIEELHGTKTIVWIGASATRIPIVFDEQLRLS